MKKFVKVNELATVNGGYLVIKDGEVPVTNEAFVQAQLQAEYIVAFAKKAKGVVFTDTKGVDLATFTAGVVADLAQKDVEFVKKGKAPKQKLTEELKNEALAFMKFGETSSKTDKVNNFMQQFVVLNDFEEFGLFFDEGIVKLNKIYTVKEILTAVNETIDLIA